MQAGRQPIAGEDPAHGGRPHRNGERAEDMANINVGLNEVEALDLSAFAVESRAEASAGANVKALGTTPGIASGLFAGPSGTYRLLIDYFNENDGASPYTLSVDGVVVASWSGVGGTAGGGSLATEAVTVALEEGSTIELTSAKDAGEYGRLDSLRVEVASGDPEAIAALGIGRTEAEDLTLAGYDLEARSDASGGFDVRTEDRGTISGAFAGDSGTYTITVEYFDESDGAADYTLAIGGTVVDAWTGSGGGPGGGTPATREITLDLAAGDVVTLTGGRDAGEFARVDALLIEPATSAPEPAPQGVFAAGLVEAEDLTLAGYAVEARADASGGANVRTTGTGTISGVFEGEAGTYALDIRYFDESDGEADYTLAINGETVHLFSGVGGSGGSGVLFTERVLIDLADGDTIDLTGVRDAGEYARVDSFLLEAADDTPPPAGPVFAVGVTEAEALTLDGYTVEARAEASSGANVRTTGTGTVSGSFEGAAGSYFLDIAYFNESDGASQYTLAINNETVHTFEGLGGSGGAGVLFTERVMIDLADGDTIALTGVRDAGEFARVDAFTLEAAGDTPPPGPATLAVGLNEIEALDLDGFLVEARADASGSATVKAPGEGEASGVFTGADGEYRLTTSFFNENDGVSPYTLAVNGVVVDTWSGVGGGAGGGYLETRTLTLSLADGDEITFTGAKDEGEYARLDSLTIEALAEEPAIAPEDADVFAFLGQSNAERHFYRESGDNSPGKLGAEVFADAISAETLAEVTTIEGARGGSGSNPLADPSSYWWDLANDRPGQPLYEAVSAIRDAIRDGRDLDAIIWAQGEDDAQAIAADGSNADAIVAAMKEATLNTFDYLWERFGRDVPVFVQQLGDHPDGEGTWLGDSVGALDLMREAQADLIAETDGVYLGATTDGADHFDTIHFSVAGYGSIAEELANTFLSGFGDDVPFA